MPTKADHNAGPAMLIWMPKDSNLNLMPNLKSDAEIEFNESTGETRKYSAYLNYNEVMLVPTSADFILEPAQVNHEIYTLM